MKATDLIKSLAISNIEPDKFSVVTLYKGQNPTTFLTDNFNAGRVITKKSIEELSILSSQDYLAVNGPFSLITPDNKSVFTPDCIYEFTGGGYVSLYAIEL